MRTKYLDFNVERIDPVIVRAGSALDERNLMSPFVWTEKDGSFSILVRAVPKVISETGNTGTIWYGRSADGLAFELDTEPTLSPSSSGQDAGGCEDPTVVIRDGRYIVYYTGVAKDRSHGKMLYAVGNKPNELKKMGVAHASTKTEGNTKEATIERTADGRWRLFYEYAYHDASRVGLALGPGVDGPWTEQRAPFAPREHAWDCWHLSTGPLLTTDPNRPVMFYNGATRNARWRIGWIAFDRDCTKVVDRCIEPLIVPPPELARSGGDIAFAASAIAVRGGAHLYYTLADKVCYRAYVRQS